MSDTLYNRLKKKFKVVIPNDWSNKQKGDFWEKVVADLFRQQGWKVRENISITGMQIDVLIKNDVEEIGLVECKFHQEKIDADVIDKLIGKTNRKKAKFSYLLSTSELNSTANGIVSEYNNTEQSVKLRCWCGEQLVEKFRNIYNFNIPNLDLAQENIGDIKTITLLLNQSKEFYWIAEEISSQGSPCRAIIFSASSNFSGSKLTLQEWKDYFVEY